MYLSVIIPAYNEQDRLTETLDATIEFCKSEFGDSFEVLVVDDGSTDKTSSLVLEYASRTNGRLQLLTYGGNRGKGYAVRYGMLRAKGEWRLFCDADLATPIEEYLVVRKAMDDEKTDIGIGSRPLKESKLLVRQPLWRECLGRTFNKVVQLAVPGIDDTQCGFKIFRGTVAEDIFSRCQLDLYAFDVESLFVAQKLGYTISEVPIRWSHKDGSKVSMLRDGLRMVADLLIIYQTHHALREQADQNPSASR